MKRSSTDSHQETTSTISSTTSPPGLQRELKTWETLEQWDQLFNDRLKYSQELAALAKKRKQVEDNIKDSREKYKQKKSKEERKKLKEYKNKIREINREELSKLENFSQLTRQFNKFFRDLHIRRTNKQLFLDKHDQLCADFCDHFEKELLILFSPEIASFSKVEFKTTKKVRAKKEIGEIVRAAAASAPVGGGAIAYAVQKGENVVVAQDERGREKRKEKVSKSIENIDSQHQEVCMNTAILITLRFSEQIGSDYSGNLKKLAKNIRTIMECLILADRIQQGNKYSLPHQFENELCQYNQQVGSKIKTNIPKGKRKRLKRQLEPRPQALQQQDEPKKEKFYWKMTEIFSQPGTKVVSKDRANFYIRYYERANHEKYDFRWARHEELDNLTLHEVFAEYKQKIDASYQSELMYDKDHISTDVRSKPSMPDMYSQLVLLTERVERLEKQNEILLEEKNHLNKIVDFLMIGKTYSEEISDEKFIKLQEEKQPKTIQMGWNCFDVAISKELNKHADLAISHFNRGEFIKYALEQMSLAEYRALLAPEIRHAAALAAVHMNLADDSSEDKKRAQEIANLFALAEELKRNGFDVAEFVNSQVSQLLEQRDNGLSAFALPEVMRTPTLRQLFSEYTQAHENMIPHVRECNERIDWGEGHRLSMEELDTFFKDEDNRQQYEQAYNTYQAQRDVVFKEAEQAFLDYCCSEEACRQYIREYYGKRGWFAFQANTEERSTSMIDIVARYLKVDIVIYHQVSRERLYATDIGEERRILSQPLEITFNGHDHFTAGKPTVAQLGLMEQHPSIAEERGELVDVSSNRYGMASSGYGTRDNLSPQPKQPSLAQLCQQAERVINRVYADDANEQRRQLASLENYQRLLRGEETLEPEKEALKCVELQGWIEAIAGEQKEQAAHSPTP